MSKEEFWMVHPDDIPEAFYDVLKDHPCNGVSIKKYNNENIFFTYSPTIVAIFLCKGIAEELYNINSRQFPLEEIVDTYIKGFTKGYNECQMLIQDTYLPEFEKRNPGDIMKQLYQIGREWKKECYCPNPISEFAIYNIGFSTGRTVALSDFIHQKKDWYKNAFGVELVCTAEKPMFENFKPIEALWLTIVKKSSNIDLRDPKNIKLLPDSITQERHRIALTAWDKRKEISQSIAKSLAKEEAEKYNETTGGMLNKKVHPLQFADYHAYSYVKAYSNVKFDLDKNNKRVKAKLTLTNSYDPPLYITPDEYINYYGYIKQQYEELQKKTSTETEPEIKLTLRQYALIRAYENKPIANDDRAKEAAARYCGKQSKTSGQQLYEHYLKVTTPSERTNFDKEKAIKEMIKDISAILPHLHSNAKKQAKNELDTLQAKIS